MITTDFSLKDNYNQKKKPHITPEQHIFDFTDMSLRHTLVSFTIMECPGPQRVRVYKQGYGIKRQVYSHMKNSKISAYMSLPKVHGKCVL